MLATMNYAAFALQTSAAILQVATPMTGDRAALGQPAPLVASTQTWSDRRYQFNFTPLQINEVKIDEAQSRTLHNALIASFDEFVAPILIL